MTTINPYFTNTPSFTTSESEVGGSRSSNAELFEAASEQSTDLEVRTAEGDRVTISYGQQEAVSYAAYENLVQDGGGFSAERGESLSYESSFGFSVSVEGDLSEQELADIGSLLNELDSVMGKMLTGDMDGAFEEAQGVGGFDSIAGFEANLKVEQRIYSERSYMIEAPTEQLNSGIEQAGGLFNTGGDSGSGLFGSGLENPGGLLDSVKYDQMVSLFDDMIDQMMKSIDDTGLESDKVEKPVDNYFDALKGSLLEEVPEDAPAVQMTDRIHSGLMDALRTAGQGGVPAGTGELEA